MMIKIILPCLVLFVLITGCAARRNLIYFSNLANSAVINDADKVVRIHEHDLLNIALNSLNAESNLLFSGNKNNAADSQNGKGGYKVNDDGYVHLPLIGDIRVEDMTIKDAEAAIALELTKHVKNPEVEIQIVNFKITVIGEVNKPASFLITGENVNLLEALGMAGDMTVYGKRENVLVIRTENGHKVLSRLNLNNLQAINSPYFNLRQNDIVYVEPDNSKAVEYSQNTRMIPIIIASISAVAVLAAVLLRR